MEPFPGPDTLSARLIPIEDPGDPRVAAFRDVRERDLRGRTGRFVAEGTVVLRVLASVHGGATGMRAEAILVLENRVAGVAGLLEAFPAEVPVFVSSRSVMDTIAGFPIHRGVLAIGRHEAAGGAADGTEELLARLPAESLVLAASGVSNHDNMGGLIRNAAAFGADALLLDDLCCDPLYRKAIRVSVGAALKVPFARAGSLDAMIAALDAAGFELWGLSPSGEVPVERIRPGRRAALLVGTEGEGLPEDILANIRTARIAQAPFSQETGMDSLNLATAAGIALHAVAGAMGRLR